jgi:hypothetical protein
MNYDNQTKIHDYWWNKILPHFTHKFTAITFDDYLRRFSFLPSGKWLKEMESVRITRVYFQIDPEPFVKEYAKYCVTNNAPTKPEDGLQRVIYQLSPTLHFEASFWVWVEHEKVHAYASVLTCYHSEKEYRKFVDDLYKFKCEGNTEDKPEKPGFGGMVGFGNA